jgi:hypothetical protein
MISLLFAMVLISANGRQNINYASNIDTNDYVYVQGVSGRIYHISGQRSLS